MIIMTQLIGLRQVFNCKVVKRNIFEIKITHVLHEAAKKGCLNKGSTPICDINYSKFLDNTSFKEFYRLLCYSQPVLIFSVFFFFKQITKAEHKKSPPSCGSCMDVSWSCCVSVGIHHFTVETQTKRCSGCRHWAHCVVGSQRWVLLTLHIRWLAVVPVAPPVSLLVPIMQLVWVIYSNGCIERRVFFHLRGNGLCRS